MVSFFVTCGLGLALLAVYRISKLWKKSKQKKRIDMFLSSVALMLMIEAIDKVTIKWLYSFVGNQNYYIFIAFLLDLLILGIPLRDTEGTIPKKEKIKDWIKLCCVAMYITWYLVCVHPYRI